jgi:hypothetical protein
MDPALSGSSFGRYVQPTTEKPLRVTPRKRSKRLQGNKPLTNNGGHSPRKDGGPLRNQRWPGITLQPELPPTSQEQLAADVKGIYAGLVMVEAKCINIDAQKASHPHEELSTEQNIVI